jgi:hypothetical protein
VAGACVQWRVSVIFSIRVADFPGSDATRSVNFVIQGVSKRDLQWYFKCYCVASVTKTFTLKGVQTIHR